MKKSYIAIFLVLGLFAGLLLTWQVLSNAPVDSNLPADELEAKETLFKEFLDEQSYLQQRIVTLRNEIDDAQKEKESQIEISDIEILDSLKKEVGLSELRGKGIEITLKDSPYADRDSAAISDAELIQAADLRDIINVLNASNADAISINNQRIIATSPISSVGTTILINNSYVSPPFTIRAIGDVGIMLDRLLNEASLTSIYERSAKYRIIFEIAEKEWITVPVYNGDINVNFINLVE